MKEKVELETFIKIILPNKQKIITNFKVID